MSEKSEMDEITRQSGRTLRQILDTAHTWYQRHLLRRTDSGDKPIKLTRAQRKQLAAHLEAEIGAQRIAEVWFTRCVHEYQAARNRLWDARLAAGADRDDYHVNEAVLQQLEGMRFGIESTVHESALSTEQRGQVVQALNDLDDSPRIRVQHVFTETNPRTAPEFREIAARSEQRVFARHQAAAQAVAVERAQLAYRSDPKHLAADTEDLRRRIAALESGRRDPNTLDSKHFVATVGPSALIGHRDEAQLASTPHADRPRTGTTFASVADAYAWTRQQLGFYRSSSRRGDEFTAVVWDRRDPAHTAQAAVGPLGMVTDEVHEWDRAHHLGRPTVPARDHAAPAQPPGPDPRPAETGQGREGADERVAAVQAIRRAQADWSWRTPDIDPAVRDSLDAARNKAARRARDAGLTDEEINREFATAADNSRFEVRMQTRDRDGYAHNEIGLHPTESAAAEWAQRRAQSPHCRNSHHLAVGISAHDTPGLLYHVDGPPGIVADELTTYRDGLRRDRGPTPAPAAGPEPGASNIAEQRLADIEAQLTELRGDRDTLARDVGVLQRGLDAVTRDRDEQQRAREAAEADAQALRNTTNRQAAELKDLREKVIQTGVERDKFRTERDQAVQKLAQATPEQQRFGSKARRDAERKANGHNQHNTEFTPRFAVQIYRRDVWSLARAQGVTVEELPESQRPIQQHFDSEAEALDWARQRVSTMEVGGQGLSVDLADSTQPGRIKFHPIDGQRQDVLTALDERRKQQPRTDTTPRETTTDHGNPPETPRPPIERSR
ncbi:hypothetical protein [Nocardia sp. NPDC127526]|uniref:hypothetical protein n=1 Tax=Nocardia sp. NPDC127526 TaxID=3345393 RepID=UPI00362B8D71